MANLRMAAQRLLDKHDVDMPDDFLHEIMELVLNLLMEAQVTELVGADRYERSADRSDHRNGKRHRRWDTRVGTLDLMIPRLREESYFPSFLEHRRRSEKALLAVIQEAYVDGIGTRKMDRLAKSLGIDGISRSQVSVICSEIDELVEEWRNRPLDEPIVYLYLDATYPKIRESGRVNSMGAVVAIGVTATGRRRILGIDIGASESGEFWQEFLRSLVARGLDGVLLVISDAHEGLHGAIASTLAGAAWQRCRVHFMRNALAHVTKADTQKVTELIRSIFAQTSHEDAHRRLGEVVDRLQGSHPRVAEMLVEAEEDLLAYATFPTAHWKKLWSTNPLERLNREIKRRIDVVGIFPNRPAAVRLIGAVLLEQDDEWMADRRYISEESMSRCPATIADVAQPKQEAPIPT